MAVTAPDIVFESNLVLDEKPLVSVIDALNTQFKFKEPGHVLPVQPSKVNQRIGVRNDPPNTTDDSAGFRSKLLGARPSLLTGRPLEFAIQIDIAFIAQSTQKAYEDAPHVLNASFQGDPNGRIHLNPFVTVEGVVPGALVTTISGRVTSPSVIEFKKFFIDKFWLVNGKVTVETSEDKQSSGAQAANAFLDLFLLPFVGLDNIGLIPYLSTASLNLPASSSPGGLIATLLLTDVPIPGKRKAHLTYDRRSVSKDSIIVGGTIGLMNRKPTVTIDGAAPRAEVGDESAAAKFTASTADMLPPLTFDWSATPAGSVKFSGSGATRQVTFKLGGSNAKPHAAVFDLKVTVRDAEMTDPKKKDGVAATRSVTVMLHDPDGKPAGKSGSKAKQPA